MPWWTARGDPRFLATDPSFGVDREARVGRVGDWPFRWARATMASRRGPKNDAQVATLADARDVLARARPRLGPRARGALRRPRERAALRADRDRQGPALRRPP